VFSRQKERFVHKENIYHYPKLEQEQDKERRNIVRRLLTEEEAKDAPRLIRKTALKNPIIQPDFERR
jgi:hypothetical protein